LNYFSNLLFGKKKSIQFNDFIIYDSKFMKALQATYCLNENIDNI